MRKQCRRERARSNVVVVVVATTTCFVVAAKTCCERVLLLTHVHSLPFYRSTRATAAAATRRPAARVADLGLHRPAELGPAHRPHGGPGMPRHGPQQGPHHRQDQVHMRKHTRHICMHARMQMCEKMWAEDTHTCAILAKLDAYTCSLIQIKSNHFLFVLFNQVSPY